MNDENESPPENVAGSVPNRTMTVPEPDRRAALTAIDNRVAELQEDVGRSGAVEAIISKITGKTNGTGKEARGAEDGGESFGDGSQGDGETNEADKCPAVSDSTPGTGECPSAGNEVNDENRVNRLRLFQADAAESLKERLQRLVRPVSVEEYRSLLNVYRAYDSTADEVVGGLEGGMEDMSLGTEDSGMKDHDDESDSNDEEDEDVEEEDFIDTDIHARARRLREEVRVASTRVRELRDVQAKRAVKIAEIEIEALTKTGGDGLSGANIRAVEEYFSGIGEGDRSVEDLDLAGNGESSVKIVAMRTSLDTLASSLRTVDAALPGKIEALQQTVGAVDVELRRRSDGRNGGGPTLSQIERAIISRDNEGRRPKWDSGDALSRALEEEQERERERARGLRAGERFALLMGGGFGGV